MKKIKILGILLIAIGGALLIYSHFEKIRKEEVVINKFNQEYNLNDENNVFEYKNIDEILDLFNNKTGIIFLCTPTSKWCQKYALYLNQALKENNYNDKVYYLDITMERSLNTIKYQKLLENLQSFLYKDDEGNSKINMPDLTFVKDGIALGHDNDTSLIPSDVNENDYWNKSKINEFKNQIKSYLEVIK